TQQEWKSAVHERSNEIVYMPSDAPREIVRRLIAKAVRRLATEGEPELRGRELDQLVEALRKGEVSTVRGVRCDGSRGWRFTQARRRSDR
ncbi:MAG TPA: hypothetical protein VE968_05415, partial [Sphingomicrobium sp.]|nr:hypothetical protein [Sphingomicrobium sp.]